MLNKSLLSLMKSASVRWVQKRSTDTDTSVLLGHWIRNREFDVMSLRIVTNRIRQISHKRAQYSGSVVER